MEGSTTEDVEVAGCRGRGTPDPDGSSWRPPSSRGSSRRSRARPGPTARPHLVTDAGARARGRRPGRGFRSPDPARAGSRGATRPSGTPSTGVIGVAPWVLSPGIMRICLMMPTSRNRRRPLVGARCDGPRASACPDDGSQHLAGGPHRRRHCHPQAAWDHERPLDRRTRSRAAGALIRVGEAVVVGAPTGQGRRKLSTDVELSRYRVGTSGRSGAGTVLVGDGMGGVHRSVTRSPSPAFTVGAGADLPVSMHVDVAAVSSDHSGRWTSVLVARRRLGVSSAWVA